LSQIDVSDGDLIVFIDGIIVGISLVSSQRSNDVIFLLDDDHNFTYEQIYCDTY
jgi:hypothetical protein